MSEAQKPSLLAVLMKHRDLEFSIEKREAFFMRIHELVLEVIADVERLFSCEEVSESEVMRSLDRLFVPKIAMKAMSSSQMGTSSIDVLESAVIDPDDFDRTEMSRLELPEPLDKYIRKQIVKLRKGVESGEADIEEIQAVLDLIRYALLRNCPGLYQAQVMSELQLQGFQDVRLIGEGGMGMLFEGRFEGGDLVAVKVERSQSAVGRDCRSAIRVFYSVERDFYERVANSPNFLKYYGHGDITIGRDSLGYIILEHCSGPRRNIGRGPEMLVDSTRVMTLAELQGILTRLPVAFTALIGLHAIAAVLELHKLGILHRDVKPFNFLIRDKVLAGHFVELAQELDENSGELPHDRLVHWYGFLKQYEGQMLTLIDFNGALNIYEGGPLMVESKRAGKVLPIMSKWFSKDDRKRKNGHKKVDDDKDEVEDPTHSDRYGLASVLYFLCMGNFVTGLTAEELPELLREVEHIRIVDGDDDMMKAFHSALFEIINDTKELDEQDESRREVHATSSFLSEMRRLLRDHEVELMENWWRRMGRRARKKTTKFIDLAIEKLKEVVGS